MSTSTLGYFTRFDETLVDDEDPLDTGLAYRAVNNLEHLADQRAQTHINWKIKSGAQGLQIDPDDTISTTEWTFLYKSTGFDLDVRADGTSNRCPCWIYVHSGSGVIAATFRVALVPSAPGREFSAAEILTNGVNVSTTSVTSTTFSDNQLNAVIYLDSALVERARGTVSTVDSVGGTAVGATWLRVRLYVYVRVTSMGATPELGGVRLREFVEP